MTKETKQSLKDFLKYECDLKISLGKSGNAPLPDEAYDKLAGAIWDRLALHAEVEQRTQERELLKWCIEQLFEGCDIDGGDFQEKAEELGVLIKVKIPPQEIEANPEKYEKCLEYETNELYYPYWDMPQVYERVKGEQDDD
jgi:hypothetical protein